MILINIIIGNIKESPDNPFFVYPRHPLPPSLLGLWDRCTFRFNLSVSDLWCTVKCKGRRERGRLSLLFFWVFFDSQQTKVSLLFSIMMRFSEQLPNPASSQFLGQLDPIFWELRYFCLCHRKVTRLLDFTGIPVELMVTRLLDSIRAITFGAVINWKNIFFPRGMWAYTTHFFPFKFTF